jgi:tight adherence protein B
VVPVSAPLLGLAVTALVILGVRPRPARTPDAPAPRVRPTTFRSRRAEAIDRVLPGRRDGRRDQQLPDALDRLGSSLRAGKSIGAALAELSMEVPDPLGFELRRLARSIEQGRSVADALAVWSASERASRDVRLVAAALSVGAGAGGEVARAVDGIAATLRERHEVAAEARALATQARASATLLVTAPIVFTAVVATVEPRVIGFLVTTPIGVACLVLGVGLDVMGAAWMARITRGAG